MWLLPPLLLLFVPGSSDPSAVIRGPGEVTGPEQGWLTVQCHYDLGLEPYVKYWCQGDEWSDCKILVKTNGPEWEVKRDRVSIRDNQTRHTFTVTMEKLRREDAGTYWCGIDRTGTDHGVAVKVDVGSATTVSATTSTTTFTEPVTTEVPTSSPTVTSLHPNGRSLLSSVHFLLLVFLKLPLFLSMLGAILWVNRPQRGSVGGGLPHPENQ
ncbi:CMRF35-like molecule 5 isoform X2 [Desmodus rotundus]|uniref:CMRF35-like molecule 5 isoform X2 n=1 Tax=Desmodus rotundus TaxID=9430 RepID=UPI002380CECA|nr:CMRF35-like molecule 5 isoform X2 [Desmodus rotundus]